MTHWTDPIILIFTLTAHEAAEGILAHWVKQAIKILISVTWQQPIDDLNTKLDVNVLPTSFDMLENIE